MRLALPVSPVRHGPMVLQCSTRVSEGIPEPTTPGSRQPAVAISKPSAPRMRRCLRKSSFRRRASLRIGTASAAVGGPSSLRYVFRRRKFRITEPMSLLPSSTWTRRRIHFPSTVNCTSSGQISTYFPFARSTISFIAAACVCVRNHSPGPSRGRPRTTAGPTRSTRCR